MVRGGKVMVEDKLLPVGIQLIGRPFGYIFFRLHISLANSFCLREATLLEIAHIFELCTWKNTN